MKNGDEHSVLQEQLLKINWRSVTEHEAVEFGVLFNDYRKEMQALDAEKRALLSELVIALASFITMGSVVLAWMNPVTGLVIIGVISLLTLITRGVFGLLLRKLVKVRLNLVTQFLERVQEGQKARLKQRKNS